MSTQDIFNYAEKKGLTVDYYTSVFDMWGDKVYPETHIGFEFQKNVYYWWRVFSEGNGEETLFFDHRYNRNNGVVQKTFRKGFAAEKKITQ